MSELASFPSLHFSPPLAALAEPLSPLSHSSLSLSCSSSSSSRSPQRSSPARPPPHPPSLPTAARASAAQQSLQTAEQQREETGREERGGGAKRATRLLDEESNDGLQAQQHAQHGDTVTGATLAAIGRRWDELLQHNRTLQEENWRLRHRLRLLEEQHSLDGGYHAQSYAAAQERQSAPPSPPPAASVAVPFQPVSAASSSQFQHGDDDKAGDAIRVEYAVEEDGQKRDGSSESQDSSEAVFRILLGDTRHAEMSGRRGETDAQPSLVVAHAPISTTNAAAVPAEPRSSVAREAGLAVEEFKAVSAAQSISDADRLLLEMDEDEPLHHIDVHEPFSGTTSRHERKQIRAEDPFATQAVSQPPPHLNQQSPPQPHVLTNEDVRARLADARQERKQANDLYSANQLQPAISHYNLADQILAALPVTEAVTNELHLLLASRAPAYIKLPDPVLALADAERLMAIKPQWWKSFALKARSLAALHRMDEAQDTFDAGLRCDLSSEERDRLLEKKTGFERKWQRFKADHQKTTAGQTARFQPSSPIPSSETSTASTASLTSNKTVISSSSTASTSGTTRTAPVLLPPSSLDAYYAHPHPEAQHAARLPPLPEQPEDDSTQQPPHTSQPNSPVPPTPTKLSAQLYSVLPRVTMEGLRDLLGDDGLMMAEEWVEAVHAIKVKRDEDDVETGAAVVLVQAKCKSWRPHDRSGRKRKRAAITSGGDGGDRAAESGVEGDRSSSTSSMLDVRIRFQGNRVTEWSCTCYQPHVDNFPQSTQQQTDAEDDEMAESVTPGLAHAKGEYVDNVNHDLIPCKHVGAALLLVRKKQSHTTTTPPSSSPAATLYVHPSHALPAAVTATLPSLASQYASLTVNQLRQLLELNSDKVTGVKEELAQRCVEGRVRGVLPACDRCGGRRYYANSNVHCRGVFDVNRKRRVPCYLHWPEQAVPRRPWKE